AAGRRNKDVSSAGSVTSAKLRRRAASKRADRARPRRRRVATSGSLSGLRTPRSGAPSHGATERRQEHHALPVCVRGEELRNLVVEEGESRGAETKCVGGEVEAATDDPSLELSGPIAAITKPGEDPREIRKAVEVHLGRGRKRVEWGGQDPHPPHASLRVHK